MRKQIGIILFLTTAVVLAFCKKSVDNSTLLIGKWKIDSVQLRMVFNNQVIYQTVYKPSFDYYDFRADNKLYRLWMAQYDTVLYNIVSLNNKSLIHYQNNNSDDTIITLTRNSLIFKNPQGNDSKIFLTK